MTIVKISYKVQNKNGEIKSYVDKRFCYCDSYHEPHIHQKIKEVKS